MFNDANGTEFKKVVIACGYTDGRLGINGLASLISLHYKLDPYEKGILFLFCGRRKDRCKARVSPADEKTFKRALLLARKRGGAAAALPKAIQKPYGGIGNRRQD